MPTPFRILDNRPVYWDTLADRPAAGGRLDFFTAGTLAPKLVYQGPDLSVSNGSSVLLDSAGRTTVDTWGDGPYKVRLYTAAGVLVSEADNVQVAGGALAIPTPIDGRYLTSVGGLPVWGSIFQVPDPTGQNGKTLKSDGVNAIWQTVAATVANGVLTITANSIKLSNGTSAVMLQWGTDTVPAIASPVSNKAITFPTPFTTLYHVDGTVNGGAGVANPVGGIPVGAMGSRSAAGATFNIDTNAYGLPVVNIINPVPFSWFAIGAVAP